MRKIGRILLKNELSNTRLANEYGGWMYCESCNQTIGYLCYVTYNEFRFDYECNCGGRGNIRLSFINQDSSLENLNQLIGITVGIFDILPMIKMKLDKYSIISAFLFYLIMPFIILNTDLYGIIWWLKGGIITLALYTNYHYRS